MRNWQNVFSLVLIIIIGLSFSFATVRAASKMSQGQFQLIKTLSPGSNSAEDTFNRTSTTAGWGSTTNGDGLTNLAWGDDAASSSLAVIGENRAELLYPGTTGVSVRGYLPVSATQSGEVLAKFSFSAVGQDYTGLTLDHTSGDSNWYQLRFSTVGNDLVLYKKYANTFHQLGEVSLSFTTIVNTWYFLRFNVTTTGGTATLEGRAWQEGTTEPSSWQITVTDNSALPAGAVGVEALWPNIGTGQSISVEDFAYAPTGHATMPSNTIIYHTDGQTIVDNAGNVLPVYGVQVGELMYPKWSGLDSTTNLTQGFIQAMHDTWYSNTLRLQLTNENLCAPGTTTFDSSTSSGYCKSGAIQPNSSYVSEIQSIITWAEQADMNIIINLQYSSDRRYSSNPTMPITDSSYFWKYMAQTFAGDSHVWFDLFNEPNLGSVYPSSLQCPNSDFLFCGFDCLKNGYNSNDNILKYCIDPSTNSDGIGYESLVQTIRQYDTSNLLIAEGLNFAKDGQWVHYTSGTTLDYDLRLSDTGTVGVQNQIIYAIHPYFDPNNKTQSDWDSNFGTDYSTAGSNSKPFVLIADEFGVFDTSSSSCNNSFPGGNPLTSTLFPYIQGKGIGLVGYSMLPGHLINVVSGVEPWPVNSPTTETSSNFACSWNGPGNQYGSDVYGDGQAQENQDISYNTYWP